MRYCGCCCSDIDYHAEQIGHISDLRMILITLIIYDRHEPRHIAFLISWCCVRVRGRGDGLCKMTVNYKLLSGTCKES